jgi:hypothetical protein
VACALSLLYLQFLYNSDLIPKKRKKKPTKQTRKKKKNKKKLKHFSIQDGKLQRPANGIV